MANISLGFAAVLVIVRADFYYSAKIAAALIMLGGVCDFFDGYFARKLDATSNFGKQLDSFADLVTFGVAPAALVNYFFAYNFFIAVLSPGFLIAGAYRLARFNLDDNKYIMGLPITAAGIILGICGLVIESALVMGIIMILLAFLMVSKRKFFNRLHSVTGWIS